MKIDFKLSTHTVYKHLDASHSQASVFFDKGTMYESIERCLENPNVCTKLQRHLCTTLVYWDTKSKQVVQLKWFIPGPNTEFS